MPLPTVRKLSIKTESPAGDLDSVACARAKGQRLLGIRCRRTFIATVRRIASGQSSRTVLVRNRARP
jgi:hypothetical protein